MQLLLLSFALSFAITYLIVRYSHLHAHLTQDTFTGVQKIHSHPVPRIGGLGIFCAFVGAALFVHFFHSPDTLFFSTLIIMGLLPYGSGLYEDVSKSVPPSIRLGLAILGALGGVFFLDATLNRLAFPWIDAFLTWQPLAVFITVIAVAGLTHAFNIIDGFNGLASLVAMMCLLALAYVAFQVGDQTLLNVCLVIVGGTAGFFVFNWPRGLIFLGDGGAYLLGFVIAEISVLLVTRHPEVSPWFPFTLCLYPVLETLFSMYRRRLIHNVPMSHPDNTHFHTLIYCRLVRSALSHDKPQLQIQQNSTTSVYLWVFHSLSTIPALLFWRSTTLLVCSSLAFVLMYLWLYRRIVRFRTPFFLK